MRASAWSTNKFGLCDGEFVGVEALVRWPPHPERGLLGPYQFLPLVREYGLMRSLTDLVIERALDDVARWAADGFRVPMAVNMFAPSLCDPDLPDRIKRSLDECDLGPDLLTIEITEDLLLDDVDGTRQVLDALRERGTRVAIDDFGSGYSALGTCASCRSTRSNSTGSSSRRSWRTRARRPSSVPWWAGARARDDGRRRGRGERGDRDDASGLRLRRGAGVPLQSTADGRRTVRPASRAQVDGTSFIEIELMQYRWSVGVGYPPSPSKT